MINIYHNNLNNGPGKVSKNLINGLKIKNLSFKENEINDYLKDSNLFLQYNNLLEKEEIISKSIIGPNICTLPFDNKIVIEQKYLKTIVPSEWVKKLYSKWIDKDKIEIWPVGIDYNYFKDFSKEKKEIDCLIYFKRREESDLIFIEEFLRDKNQTYTIIKYGNYDEQQFINLISKSRYCVVIDNCESQGVAIQEIMSCNLPLFVWDVKFWKDRGEEYKIESTSIPYWDEKCGEFFFYKEEIEEKFKVFMEKIDYYKPRNYILKNLKIEDQSEKLYKLIKTNNK
jgi:hypothetical protein